MNDFTKDELKLILHKFGYLTFSQFQGLGNLSMKINNMIEDYCEHNGHNYEFSLGRGKCENCGELE